MVRDHETWLSGEPIDVIVLNTKVMLIEPVDRERRLRQEVGSQPKRVLTKLIEIRKLNLRKGFLKLGLQLAPVSAHAQDVIQDAHRAPRAGATSHLDQRDKPARPGDPLDGTSQPPHTYPMGHLKVPANLPQIIVYGVLGRDIDRVQFEVDQGALRSARRVRFQPSCSLPTTVVPIQGSPIGAVIGSSMSCRRSDRHPLPCRFGRNGPRWGKNALGLPTNDAEGRSPTDLSAITSPRAPIGRRWQQAGVVLETGRLHGVKQRLAQVVTRRTKPRRLATTQGFDGGDGSSEVITELCRRPSAHGVIVGV